jgi:hypothetical protein
VESSCEHGNEPQMLASSLVASQLSASREGLSSTQLVTFLLICIVRVGVQTGSTRHVGQFWPTVPARGDMRMEILVE